MKKKNTQLAFMKLDQLVRDYDRMKKKYLQHNDNHWKLLTRLSKSEDTLKWFRFNMEELEAEIALINQKGMP